MKPLYTQTEFDAAKSRDKLPLECLHCGKTFHRRKSYIRQVLRPNRRESATFCSNKCQNDFQTPPIIKTCEQCGHSFRKKPRQVKKTKHHFCSQSCAAIWHNNHKTTGTRVSKLERWLQEQLVLLFPSLEFHFNRRDAIKAELDIYVPALRLAFELNGIFHYEPIYGPEKLGRIQNNDERKMQACLEHGIELCIVDISTMTYFKPTKAQKFLDIIANLIRSKLSGDLPISLPIQSLIGVP